MNSPTPVQSLDTVRVPKAAELVAASLRRSIVRGELREGDTLPSESLLLQQFGVSRPTLREAFRVLESERLISVRRGSRGGAHVHAPDGATAARFAGLALEFRGTLLVDVFEATAALEAPCAARLATKRKAGQLARLEAAVAWEDAVSGDPAELLVRQTQFHQLVVDLGDNQTIGLLSEMLRYVVDTASVRLANSPAGRTSARAASETGSRAHRKLVELIIARDAEGAELLWRKHILQTCEHLLGTSRATTVLDMLE